MKNPFNYFDKIEIIAESKQDYDILVEKLKLDQKIYFRSRSHSESETDCKKIMEIQNWNGRLDRRFPENWSLGRCHDHVNILKEAKSENRSNVLVFQVPGCDNIVENYKDIVNCAFNDLKKIEWDILYLGWHNPHGIKKLTKKHSECLFETFPHNRCGVGGNYAICYNSSCFDILIDKINPFNRHLHGPRGYLDRFYRKSPYFKRFMLPKNTMYRNK